MQMKSDDLWHNKDGSPKFGKPFFHGFIKYIWIIYELKALLDWLAGC